MREHLKILSGISLLVLLLFLTSCNSTYHGLSDTTGNLLRDIKAESGKRYEQGKQILDQSIIAVGQVDYEEKLSYLIEELKDFNIEDARNLNSEVAYDLAQQIKKLHKLDKEVFESPEKFKKFIQDANGIIKISNENLNTNIPIIKLEDPDFKKIANSYDKIQKYSPVIGPYNRMIDSAYELNVNDSNSIIKFYSSIASVALDIVIIHERVAHKVTFATVGKLNNEFGLAGIRKVCGNTCHSFILKQAYYFINTYIIELKDSLEAWLLQ